MINFTYFAKTKKFSDFDKNRLVSIARFQPNNIKIKTFKVLAPPIEMINEYKRTRDVMKFTVNFNKYLNELNVHKIAGFLNGYILCCYEKSTDFCHRHLVKKWFEKNGYDCEEL